MDGMAGMNMAPPPIPMRPKKRIVMHMEFFWGTVTEVLFNDWPGIQGTGQYILSLILVFVLAVLLEWISRIKIAGNGDRRRVAMGMLRTGVHTVRVGLAYLVMLAIMSFNGGVFLAIVAGHALGYLIFRERILRKSGGEDGLEKDNSNGLHC